MWRMVLLPQPEGPSRTTNSPLSCLGIKRLTSLTASETGPFRCVANDLRTVRSSTIGAAAVAAGGVGALLGPGPEDEQANERRGRHALEAVHEPAEGGVDDRHAAHQDADRHADDHRVEHRLHDAPDADPDRAGQLADLEQVLRAVEDL